jgi:hypothetical protein
MDFEKQSLFFGESYQTYKYILLGNFRLLKDYAGNKYEHKRIDGGETLGHYAFSEL